MSTRAGHLRHGMVTSTDVSLMDKAVTPAVLKKDDEEPPKAVTSEVPPKPEPKKVDPSKAMPPKTVPPAVLKKDNEEPPKPGSSKAVPPAVLKNDEEPPKVEPPKPLPPVVLKSDKEPSKAMPPKTVPPAVLKKDNEEPPKPGPSKAMPPKPLPPTVLKKDDKNRKVRVDYIQFTRTEPSPVAVVAPLAFGREMQYFHYIQLKKMYTFRVSRVVSPADFCLMYVSERPPQREFEVSGAPDELGNISPTMWTDMQFFYKLDGIRTEYKLGTDPHKQQMYACREGEGSKEQYHRITILTKDTYNDRANVLFVDSGLRKLVNFDQLYELPVCFTDPPALAFNEDICTAFRNMTIGQRVTAVVHSKNVHHFEDTTVAQCHLSATLYLLDDPVTLQEKLITSGWARAAPKTAAAAATATPPN
ncbi:hypothetical protein Fcan01_14156 [Folsomia candida]|uniref:Tudor domain-containing protein n=1 Tax=Folsomia candida TaxID=158441 RepID=A0A226E2D2_FOLCA|nr:hypothetical protein Fcan01_14156 [Folsomia candida]